MTARIIIGDVREKLAELPDESVHCVVTSPPYYGLRDYDVAGQIGLEDTLDEYITVIVGVFREVRRVLRSDGTLWLNIGDCYAGSWGAQSRCSEAADGLSARQIAAHPRRTGTGSIKRTLGLKPKDLMMVPARLALALQSDGWWVRQDIIWAKPNPMPESITDRCTKAHEYLFLLSKSARYYFDADAIAEKAVHAGEAISLGPKSLSKGQSTGMGREPSGNAKKDTVTVSDRRNKRSVWTVTTEVFKDAHFATFPTALVAPCILAGCPEGGTVLDPFGGAGTTALVADRLLRNSILIELNPEYAEMARARITGDAPLIAEVS
jgi:DNA modification methylase